jgi:hypothetical protein
MSAQPKDVQQPQSLGAMIDLMADLRAQRRDLSKQVDELTAQMASLETRLIAKLDEEDLNSSRGKTAYATISEDIVPQIENWDDVYAYIKENDAFYLLQRRMTVTAYRELVESGDSLPGANPLKKRSISIHTS